MAVGIYFLGSGKLGIPILHALSADPRVKLLGIGSQPDRPVGRKKQLAPTAFAQAALSCGFDVERVTSVNAPEFLEHLRELNVELLLVVAFGQLLKRPVLELPPFGCLNVHASILPKYRGACPINSALLNGDVETGVTFMKMDVGLDTGPIYHLVKAAILPDDNAGQLEIRLGALAAKEIGQVCHGICRGGWKCVPQPETDMPNVRKISKCDGQIDWNADARRIGNMVRAYTPWPKAFTYIDIRNAKKRIQITRAYPVQGEESCGAAPGQVVQADGSGFKIACGNGCLVVEKLVPEGRNEMTATDFLRGNPVPVGTVLG